MKHQNQIKELMSKGELSNDVAWTIFDLMYYCHQPLSEIMNMPVPLLNEMLKCLEKTKKEEAKAYK